MIYLGTLVDSEATKSSQLLVAQEKPNCAEYSTSRRAVKMNLPECCKACRRQATCPELGVPPFDENGECPDWCGYDAGNRASEWVKEVHCGAR